MIHDERDFVINIKNTDSRMKEVFLNEPESRKRGFKVVPILTIRVTDYRVQGWSRQLFDCTDLCFDNFRLKIISLRHKDM